MSFKRLNREYMIGLIALSMLGLNACDNSSENESNISDNANAVTDGQPVNAPLYNAIVAIYNTQRNQIAGTGTLIHPKYVLTSSNIVHTGACENGIKKLFESNSAIGFGNTLSEITSNLHPIKKYHIGCNFTLIELETPVSETEAYPLQLISPDEAVTRNQLVNETIRFDSVGFNSLKGSDDYGIKFQTKVSALDICSESNKDSINGCLYSSDKTTIPFGTLYSRFSLGTAKLGDGAPVFVTTDTFPGIAVAAVANAATAINNDN